MKIQSLEIIPFQMQLTTGQLREGIYIQMQDEFGNIGWGETAPLPKWSSDTLSECKQQLHEKIQEVTQIEWSKENWITRLAGLKLLPALTFGIESAVLSILDPLPKHHIKASALLMGTPEKILEQAQARQQEGYLSAKLKVSNLSTNDAAFVINHLKDKFRLRIDVNRAWKTHESLEFFKQYPLDTFDYVEEPFANPHDLHLFPHPLAVDESYPSDLSLEQLCQLPTLKAMIYKPTIQGGLIGCLPLNEWAQRGITVVLSSCFESDLGLAHVASLAKRLALAAPVGIGTYHFQNEHIIDPPLHFEGSNVTLESYQARSLRLASPTCAHNVLA